jgi:hypothetical protein
MACLVLGALGAVAYIKSGIYNVAASKPHTNLTFWVTHETMIHSVRRHAASVTPPQQFSAAQVVAGFRSYQTHCVAYHGAAQVGRQRWAGGMEPSPPLFARHQSAIHAPAAVLDREERHQDDWHAVMEERDV